MYRNKMNVLYKESEIPSTQMKEVVTNILIGLIKATSAFTLIYFSSLAVDAAHQVEDGLHTCAGDQAQKDTLVDSLKGTSGEGTLAAVAASLVLVDLILHVVQTSLGGAPRKKDNETPAKPANRRWEIVDQVQHALEFAILGLSASVLHTLDLSGNDGGLQYLFQTAQCGDDYTELLPDGLALLGVSFVATLVQFLILRVKILRVVGWQTHFEHITGDQCS